MTISNIFIFYYSVINHHLYLWGKWMDTTATFVALTILTKWLKILGIYQKSSPSDSEGYTINIHQVIESLRDIPKSLTKWLKAREIYQKSMSGQQPHKQGHQPEVDWTQWQDPDSTADPWSGWHSTNQCPHFSTGSKWLFIFMATDDVPAQATWMCEKANLHVISYWVITSSRKYNKKLLHYKLSLDTHRVFKNEQTGSALHETKSLKKSVLMDGVIVKFWYNL